MKTLKRHFAIALVATLAIPCGLLHADTTWSTTPGANTNFNSSDSWNPGDGVPDINDVAIFDVLSHNNNSPELTANSIVKGFLFVSGTSSYSIAPSGFSPNSTLTIGDAGIVNNDDSTQAFNVPIILAASQSWSTASSGAITVGGTVDLADKTLTLSGNGAGASSVAGIISGSGSITKSGTGTWTLSGANTYSGGTTLSAGTLVAGNNTAFGTGTLNISGGTLAASGGVLRTLSNAIATTANFAIGGANDLTLTNSLNLGFGGTRTITVSNTGTTTISGAINESGASKINKQGAERLVLSGTNTFSAGVTIGQGTLAVQSSGALPNTDLGFAASSNVESGATLEISGNIAVNQDFFNIIGTGVGSVGAIHNLSGTNTFTTIVTKLDGDATITSSAGVLTLINEINLNNFGLTLGGSGDLSFSGPITGFGVSRIIKTGTGTVTVSGSNTYTGPTTISGGTLVFTGNKSGFGAIVVGASGKLAGTGILAGPTTVNGTISPGAITGAVGTLTTDAENWLGGGHYLWDITNATGGAGIGWDTLSLNDTLTVSSTSTVGNTFFIDITGNAANFNGATSSYSWIIASASSINGFAADKFAINATGLSSSHPGTFSISQDGNNLRLNYAAPVPEPESWGAIMGASILLIVLIRRRRMA